MSELLAMPAETARHRAAISEIAARRRVLAGELAGAIGPTEAAKRLGISRQTLWQILNPEQSKAIKRRSAKGAAGPDGAAS